MKSLDGLSINLATVRRQWSFAEAVDACLKHGITTICPWRDQIAATGLAGSRADRAFERGQADRRLPRRLLPGARRRGPRRGARRQPPRRRRGGRARRRLPGHGLRRPAGRLEGPARRPRDGDRRPRRADAARPRRRGADRDRAAAPDVRRRPRLRELARAGARHREAIGGGGIGAAIDVYHVWWEPDLANQIARAGRMGAIFAHHICDWLVPTKDLLNDRGMMGDGAIDLPGFRADDRGRGLSRRPGGRDLLRPLVEPPRRRGARHLHRAVPDRLLRTSATGLRAG